MQRHTAGQSSCMAFKELAIVRHLQRPRWKPKLSLFSCAFHRCKPGAVRSSNCSRTSTKASGWPMRPMPTTSEEYDVNTPGKLVKEQDMEQPAKSQTPQPRSPPEISCKCLGPLDEAQSSCGNTRHRACLLTCLLFGWVFPKWPSFLYLKRFLSMYQALDQLPKRTTFFPLYHLHLPLRSHSKNQGSIDHAAATAQQSCGAQGHLQLIRMQLHAEFAAPLAPQMRCFP